jgi:hypothetical protein
VEIAATCLEEALGVVELPPVAPRDLIPRGAIAAMSLLDVLCRPGERH